MSNSFVLWFVALVMALLLADWFYFEWNLPVMAGKIVADTVIWMAFWR
jgi:hypothetical protein